MAPDYCSTTKKNDFPGVKHTNQYSQFSIQALRSAMADMGLGVEQIDGWFGSWDNAAFAASLVRTMLEEAPTSFSFLFGPPTPLFNLSDLERGMRAARHVGRQLGSDKPVPLICTPHHDNHAWFSFAASPFARSERPVMLAVLDGVGDMGAISLYLCENGRMRQLHCNDSVFDSLGLYYAVISSTQGGWTWLSSEGRYMGATAYGNGDRASNPYYAQLKSIFSLEPDGHIQLNRDLANWVRDLMRNPYSDALIGILGEPIAAQDMWNPDAVLRVEDIKHKENTQERFDKAAATQMVFEDALVHVIGHFIRSTGSDRLVLTGGIGLNALGNMRLMEQFDASFYRRELNQQTRLHLWVPPVPNDSGVSIGAAYMGAYLAGYGLGEPIEHAFYCGAPPPATEIRTALNQSPDVECIELIAADGTAARESVSATSWRS